MFLIRVSSYCSLRPTFSKYSKGMRNRKSRSAGTEKFHGNSVHPKGIEKFHGNSQFTGIAQSTGIHFALIEHGRSVKKRWFVPECKALFPNIESHSRM